MSERLTGDQLHAMETGNWTTVQQADDMLAAAAREIRELRDEQVRNREVLERTARPPNDADELRAKLDRALAQLHHHMGCDAECEKNHP